MFEILKQTDGIRGSFVRLIKLGIDDFTVLLRSPDDGKIQHRYTGPDISKAEEVYKIEADSILHRVD